MKGSNPTSATKIADENIEYSRVFHVRGMAILGNWQTFRFNKRSPEAAACVTTGGGRTNGGRLAGRTPEASVSLRTQRLPGCTVVAEDPGIADQQDIAGETVSLMTCGSHDSSGPADINMKGRGGGLYQRLVTSDDGQ